MCNQSGSITASASTGSSSLSDTAVRDRTERHVSLLHLSADSDNTHSIVTAQPSNHSVLSFPSLMLLNPVSIHTVVYSIAGYILQLTVEHGLHNGLTTRSLSINHTGKQCMRF